MQVSEIPRGELMRAAFYLPAEYKVIRITPTQIKIIQAVIDAGEMTSHRLAESMGQTVQNTSTQLNSIVRKGYLNVTVGFNLYGGKENKYTVPETWG